MPLSLMQQRDRAGGCSHAHAHTWGPRGWGPDSCSRRAAHRGRSLRGGPRVLDPPRQRRRAPVLPKCDSLRGPALAVGARSHLEAPPAPLGPSPGCCSSLVRRDLPFRQDRHCDLPGGHAGAWEGPTRPPLWPQPRHGATFTLIVTQSRRARSPRDVCPGPGVQGPWRAAGSDQAAWTEPRHGDDAGTGVPAAGRPVAGAEAAAPCGAVTLSRDSRWSRCSHSRLPVFSRVTRGRDVTSIIAVCGGARPPARASRLWQ